MPRPPVAEATIWSAYVSRTGKGHLSLDCTGLDRMREAGRNPVEHLIRYDATSPSLLFAGPDFDPCRLCAIEDVALDILTAPASPALRGFAMTSLGAAKPAQRDAPATFEDEQRRNEIRDAATARIVRIAEATGLAWTGTVRGAVLYGQIPSETLHRLSRHFALAVLPAQFGETRPEVVATFWALRADAEMDPRDAWQVAQDIYT